MAPFALETSAYSSVKIRTGSATRLARYARLPPASQIASVAPPSTPDRRNTGSALASGFPRPKHFQTGPHARPPRRGSCHEWCRVLSPKRRATPDPALLHELLRRPPHRLRSRARLFSCANSPARARERQRPPLPSPAPEQASSPPRSWKRLSKPASLSPLPASPQPLPVPFASKLSRPKRSPPAAAFPFGGARSSVKRR